MHSKPRSYLLIVSLLCALGFGWMSWLVSNEKVTRFDLDIISIVQGWETPWLTNVMKFFTFIGDRYQVIILSGMVIVFLFVVLRHRKELLLFIWASVGSVALNETLKVIFARERPDIYRLSEQAGYSFPSGHAMAAFTLYSVLAYLLWRHIRTRVGKGVLLVTVVLVICIIGISRIYLGVHYPSDIIAGYMMSGCWLALSIWLYQKLVRS